MFDTEITSEPSILSWAAQQLLAVIGPLAWAITTSVVVSSAERTLVSPILGISEADWWLWVVPIAGLAEKAWWTFFVGPVGFFLALLVSRLFPTAASVGRWVWIIPTAGFLFFFLGSVSQMPMWNVVEEFFWPASHGDGPLLIRFVTFPTWSSICYSLGMLLPARRFKSEKAKLQANVD